MKRFLVLLMMLLLALPAQAESPTLLERADALAAELPHFATMEVYEVVCGGAFSPDIGECLAQAAAMIWREPVATVYLTVDMDGLMAALAQDVTVDETTMTSLEPMLASAMSNVIIGHVGGTSWASMAMANVLANDAAWIDPAQPDGTVVFLRFYADGVPVIFMVSAEDGAVVMSCSALMETEAAPEAVFFTEASGVTVIPAEEAGQPLAACRSAADVQAWLEAGGYPFVLAAEEQVVLPLAGMPMEGGTLTENVLLLAAETGCRMGERGMTLLAGSDDVATRVAAWTLVDYGAPRMMLTAQPDLRTYGPQVWGSAIYKLLDAGDARMEQRLTESLPGHLMLNLLARNADMNGIAAVSMTSFAGLYADAAQEDGSGMALLFYDADCAMLISWSAQGGVVSLSSLCLPLPELAACQSAAEASLWLAGQGVPMHLTEVPLD